MTFSVMTPETLSPIYFPFTFIPPSLAKVMFRCFHHVIVYQPAHIQPDNALQEWMDNGFLEVRTPAVIEKKTLEAALREFKAWGSIHRNADMSLLKILGKTMAPVDPETLRLASEIRGAGVNFGDRRKESDLPVHLFLHLAHALDRDAWELSEQLKLVDDQFRILQSSFQQDQEEEAAGGRPVKQPVVFDRDMGRPLIEKRMVAWGHLFHRDRVHSGLLFTDSEPAFSRLLENVEEKVELLNVNIPSAEPPSKEETQTDPPWVDSFSRIFMSVLTTPWNKALQESVTHAACQMKSKMNNPKKITGKLQDKNWSSLWYVVPRLTAQTVVSRRIGKVDAPGANHASDVKNTVVGLIQEDF